jgi:hypothetical protein
VVPILDARAFWSWVGPATHHQDYTKESIGAPVTFSYGNGAYSFSSKALSQINLANGRADASYLYDPRDHFDDEGFLGSLNQLWLRRQELDAFLGPRFFNQQMAWELLGSMLHTIQDFYAHSSWVENGNTDVILGFATYTEDPSAPTIPPGFHPAVGDVCSNGSELIASASPQLTTGYYNPQFSLFKNQYPTPAGKCDHGPLVQTCNYHLGISLDTPCGADSFHDVAKRLAERETFAFVKAIVDKLHDNNNDAGVCALLDLDPTIVSMCVPPGIAPWLGNWAGVGTSTCGYYSGPATAVVTFIGADQISWVATTNIGVFPWIFTVSGNTATGTLYGQTATLTLTDNTVAVSQPASCQTGTYTRQ